ncbi:MAG: glycosyltransferase family 4 protein [Ilumatobacteraceae bacterium]
MTLTERRLRLAPNPLRACDLDLVGAAVSDHDVVTLLAVTSSVEFVARHTVPDRELLARLDDLVDQGGAGALAAIEILASTIGEQSSDRLNAAVRSHDSTVRRHASWRLAQRRPDGRAIPALVVELERGGIDTMHAHRTLRQWALTAPVQVLRAVTASLTVASDPACRARLIDLIGVISDRGTDELLVDIAVDRYESDAARIAALGPLGERRSSLIGESLTMLAADDDLVGAHAALALQSAQPTARSERRPGLAIAQMTLASGLDGQLSRGGRGETGGVASLVVSLGDALARHPDVAHVVTIGRGSVSDALVGPVVDDAEALSYGMIAVGDPSRPVNGAGDMWEHLPAVERGIRRVLRLAGPIDVLHLRMADVGTLAGAAVAEEAQVATCLSLAPDPHNVLESMHAQGQLDASSFDHLERTQHVWFRARMIEELGQVADRVALFPRVRSFPFLDALPHRDEAEGRARTAVIAEGIDVAAARRALDEVGSGRSAIVDQLVARIPADRRGLPLLVSVGRLHPVKGVTRVVDAWSRTLHQTCNLVIVGGDMDDPSEVERGVLVEIESIMRTRPQACAGLVLLGGQAHADVNRLLAATNVGHGDAWSPGGVYVDGAVKEEFGLAVLEAMAAGLTVVAPSTGGPSTYVDHGETGILVAPGDDLATAIASAFELVALPGRTERARTVVESRYSIDTMAGRLVDLYQPIHA